MTDLTGQRRAWRTAWSIKRFLPVTLFGRALLIIITPLVLMHVISTFVFFDRHWDTVARRLTHALAGEIALVVDAMTPLPPPDEIAGIAERAGKFLNMIVTYHPERRLSGVFAFSGYDRVTFRLGEAMEHRIGLPFDVDADGGDRRIRLHFQLPDGILTVDVHEKRLYSSTPYIFLMWMLGSSLVLFAIAIIFMRNQIRPIRRLAAAARSFGVGREVADFRPEGAAEVRQAAEAFRQMQQRIRRQIRRRTDMLAGVSHDLRTPLTRMKLQLALLDDNEEVGQLEHDIHEMERMIEGYLAFSRGEGAEAPATIVIADLLSEIVAAEGRHGATVTLSMSGDRSARYQARPQALKRALVNLVANARDYAATATVTLDIGSDAITITIDDDGPGIPPEHRADVFKPFFRLDPSRNPNTGGVGLGLSIARDIVHSHGGELLLDDSPLGGLRAIVRMPV